MRTASDVLANPKPGDEVRIGPGWTRRVTQRNGDTVEFYSTFGTRSTATTIGPFGQSIQRWKNELTNVEVIHVDE
jgi:hypothetical protein